MKALYFPDWHWEQVDPRFSLYVPVAQGTHSPPSIPEYPASHLQWLIFLEFEIRVLEWSGQRVQTPSPDSDLNEPTGHP